MNAAPFAPRTIAAARTARGGRLAARWGRLGRRLFSGTVEGCAAVVRVWRQHEELVDMLHLDERLLRDIGVKRGEILAAIHERRWTRAAWRLVATAAARRHAAGGPDRDIRAAAIPARSLLPGRVDRDGAAHRLAA
jgi:hypothetical protein